MYLLKLLKNYSSVSNSFELLLWQGWVEFNTELLVTGEEIMELVYLVADPSSYASCGLL